MRWLHLIWRESRGRFHSYAVYEIGKEIFQFWIERLCCGIRETLTVKKIPSIKMCHLPPRMQISMLTPTSLHAVSNINLHPAAPAAHPCPQWPVSSCRLEHQPSSCGSCGTSVSAMACKLIGGKHRKYALGAYINDFDAHCFCGEEHIDVM